MSTVALAGCASVPNPFASKADTGDAAIVTEASKSVKLVDRDVEAPEVFQTNDTALWDGRPSLGGVWVASPDAVNPERVILRNEANGKFVIGALFRRERDNPGPKLQISSDAADALGMLAGQPGKLNVTALRRDESQVKDAAPAVQDPAAKSGDTTISADPLAAAGAALDRADGAAAAPENVDAAAIAPAPLDNLDPTPRPGETKRQARKRVRAAKAAAAAAPILPDAAAANGAPPIAAPVPTLEVAPLPDAGGAAAATTSASPTGGSARIQIGIFSVEANAQRAADRLKEGGVSADLRKEESNGKAFWSVVANGAGGSKALLAKVRQLGFSDAYVVSG